MLTRAHKIMILAGAVIGVVGIIYIFRPPPGPCLSENSPHWHFIPTEVNFRTEGKLKVLTDDTLEFSDSCKTKWVAPKGTKTDGASIPQPALAIVGEPTSADVFKAAILHDAYCAEVNEHVTPEQYHKRPWKDVNNMFYEAMIHGGTDRRKAKLIFTAVWWWLEEWDVPAEQKLPDDARTRGFVGSKNWINEHNYPSVQEIMTDAEARKPVLKTLHEQDTAIADALEQKDTAKADRFVKEEAALLEKHLAKSPTDTMLLNFKGDLHKNQAKLYQMSDRGQRVEDELRKSEETFNSVLQSEPKDPSALSGLGAVSIIRGNRVRAEEYTRKALDVAPRYKGANRNLENIRGME